MVDFNATTDTLQNELNSSNN